MKITALATICFMLATTLQAQTRVVSGNLTVFDTYPVQHVNVSSKKAKATAQTDSLGYFTLVCLEKDVILVSPQAFKPIRKKVHKDTDHVTLNLQFIDSEENRQIAVGYGYISEEHLNFGVSHMENERDDFCSYTNIYDLLRGELSGVTVQGKNVYVRGGTNSFSLSTTALLVVDGQTTSSLDWVHPCQVKSVDAIKDGNAAIYGSRGGNGVILIELVN
jgi:TonB-dependent SusC/RagA subfamily outer membrane receptor